MINELYISKSFCCIGNSLTKCFGCKYCRLLDEKDLNISYDVIPSTINTLFKQMPIAINIFYGDPLLQINNTIRILERLEKSEHTGPVVIITKGDFRLFPDIDFNLDLHFAFSTFGLENDSSFSSGIDGGNFNRFVLNLIEAERRGRYKYSIEFRPIIYGINDSRKSIEAVISIANSFELPIGYSGLQGKPGIVKYWEDNNFNFKPYPGYTFGHKKSLSEEVKSLISESAYKAGVNIFSKTSCLISYTHGLSRDYNAHYYRPNEVGCFGCVMKERCFAEKAIRHDVETFKFLLKDILPIDLDIVVKEKHECILKKKGICEFPTADCSNISGPIIKIDKQLTTADVRVIKWLTGFTVDADFSESPHLSGFWRK